jgi:hypothetical protein
VFDVGAIPHGRKRFVRQICASDGTGTLTETLLGKYQFRLTHKS